MLGLGVLWISLTIELDNVMHDTLRERSSARLAYKEALLPCFPGVELQHREKRKCNEGQDDRKAPECPAPANVLVEPFSSVRPGESGNHVRRRREGKSQASISQSGGVRGEDINGVDHATEPNRVEHLSPAWSAI